MTDSIIEDRRRALKASALVAVLHHARATAAILRHLDDDGWHTAAHAARVHPPSPATRALVARWFTEREQSASDPFVGLDDVPEAAL